jgi:hypothetical protein
MIEDGVILFIRYKMRLRALKFVRKVEDLSLIVVDIFVPALTALLNNIEISVQLSGGITVFAVCRIYTRVIRKETWIDTRCLGVSFIYTVQRGEQDETL